MGYGSIRRVYFGTYWMDNRALNRDLMFDRVENSIVQSVTSHTPETKKNIL